jgi:hypothetical protein
MRYIAPAARSGAAVLLCAALFLETTLARAASNQEVEALTQAVKKLQAENRDLARRLGAIEAEKAARKPAAPRTQTPPAVVQKTEPETTQPPPAVARQTPQPPVSPGGKAPPTTASSQSLEQRVTNLETAKTAQESAVRSIIQDTLSKAGPKINEFVSLGGAIEVTAGRSSDFTGQKTDTIDLSTAELDFDVKMGEWASGSMIIQYNTAANANVLFPTSPSFGTNIDRFIVDRAAVTIGDVQRFPIYAKVGRDVLPFGTGTGIHRSDVLSIANPLTIEVFETRSNSVGIGFALPTPSAGPAAPGVVIPPVRPLVLAPAVNSLAHLLGFRPSPVQPRAPTPVVPPPEPPPFYGAVNVYDANTVPGVNRKYGSSFNARLGYQTSGHCGVPLEELKDSFVCPWTVDFSVDYISSVFDSLFLNSEYNNFIPQFGQVPGMSADLKMNFGPILFIAEFNTALSKASFIDDAGRPIRIAPAAWQVALGYQLAWNPWVETIGGQGTYLAVGYSQSKDLAGATLTSATGGPTRVGFVPQSRLTLTAGEWVLEGTRIALEYSHNWDYSIGKGGTGRQADGVFVQLTYAW